MEIIPEIMNYAEEIGADIKEKRGSYRLKKVIAERKAFLSRRKLEYTARFRVDDADRSLKFSEMLRETGTGVSSGDAEGGGAAGFGFRKETLKTGTGAREGTIEEQSNLLGKKYNYSFDVAEIRKSFEQLAADHGYSFKYSVSGKGI